eukprot:CAMPEP_0172465370 /NCGR_PEP_ID=MMETSP1065-20121228/53299_1 /TAXON_ID=265537 /ORGANISM="Amphiprora paludosa, Strain CCMP125" /LENGTH=170 /DNA_ID=CAMNT_0013221879 /DNA_START=36 /DNA_END=548 /DNA_ORIENTATION=+
MGASTAFLTAPRVARPVTWLQSSSSEETADTMVEMTVALPPSGSELSAIMRLKPCLSVPSEFIEVRYKLPFGLSVEPKNNLAVCTKDGEGGEKVGDILRYTSQWTLGLPKGEGLAQSAGAFGGALKWQCSMFDVLSVKDWRQVVEALTTNVESRTDEVVLIFERPLAESE